MPACVVHGFSCKSFGQNAYDVYHKEPAYNLETYRMLSTSANELTVYEYYRDSSRLLAPDKDGTCGMHMRDEDFYLYFVVHSGCRASADAPRWPAFSDFHAPNVPLADHA